jgi:hypothetical protein
MVVGCMVVVMREHECVGWRRVAMLELCARGVFRVGFADIREIEKWVVRFWRRVIGMRVRAVMFGVVEPRSIQGPSMSYRYAWQRLFSLCGAIQTSKTQTADSFNLSYTDFACVTFSLSLLRDVG